MNGPQKILTNGKIYTVDRTNPWVEALAISDGRISSLGRAEEVLALAQPETEIVDLGGAMAIPGLIDNHLHILLAGQIELFTVRFPATLDLDGILAVVRDAVRNTPQDRWIVGNQWGSDLIGVLGTDAALAALDEASQGRPVMLRDETAHNRWVNTPAMRLAGIDETTEAPENGIFGRDPKSGRLTGVMIESAAGLVEKAASASITDDMAQRAIESAVGVLNSHGITGFQEAASVPLINESLKALDEAGRLSAWAVTSLPIVEPTIFPGLAGEPLLAMRDSFKSTHVLPNFTKLFLDGVPNSYTAAYHDAYLPNDSIPTGYRGEMLVSMPDMIKWVDRSEKLGMGLKVHCAGDAAATRMLDAVEAVRHFRGPTTIPHHIAHAGYLRDEDIPRFAELGVVADICPVSWFPTSIVDAISTVIGPERGERWWPNKTLIENGALVAGGTDWPVVPVPNLWAAIEGLVTRENPDGSFPGRKLWAEQAVPLEAAIEIYTINAAKAMAIDAFTGSLAVGKSADIVVLDRNVFEVPITEISATRTVATYFEGRIVHQA
ncbi:amidohydrolase [uncultured Paracoccus sp.]|uniref:amidohydrolase n=1 Tax=uncultured Paracoccus sp. TaxID=189685 RepID=UPI002592AF1A|nr:amidohydrolase [uncultured Paracoccus sp.]